MRSQAWELLFDAMLSGQKKLTQRVREGMQAELPAYRMVSPAELDTEVELEIEHILKSARAQRTVPTDVELDALAAIGETRARQGVPIADMLRAWNIGIEATVSSAREVGQHLGIDDALILEAVEAGLAWCHAAMVNFTGAHHQAEVALARAEHGRRAAFVRGALFGELTPTELRAQAEAFGLDPAREYVAFRAHFYGAKHDFDQSPASGGLCVLADGDIVGFLEESPSGDLNGVIGYGPARPLDGLDESYRLATRALTTARSCYLQGAYDLASLGLRAAVTADVDIGELLHRRYIEPLGTSQSSRDLVSTLRAYLACGTHVEQAATQLCVHQNTVRYRLARFEELTGANLRDTRVLLEVWWAVTRSAMRL